ncbi:MAG: phosphomethylpyrimidine synthase, partial [Elusimicrobiota bacterium]|nr:phosphomethylpyrimidine synthase [Elusimicrobiota bacterium]
MIKNNYKISYPSSKKVYIEGKLHNIKVAMREISLTDTVVLKDGVKIFVPNAPIIVYDTSGPYSDDNQNVDIKKGIARMRKDWIENRADSERLPRFTSPYSRQNKQNATLNFPIINLPRRAKAGKKITQMAYAKAGIITPEMEYASIRENMQNE